MKTAKIKAFIPVIIIILISLAAESLMANFVYFSFVAGKTEVTDFVPEDINGTEISAENDTVEIRGYDFPLNSVSFTVATNGAFYPDFLANANFKVADESNGGVLAKILSEKTAVGHEPRRTTVYLNSGGNSYGMDIQFSSYPVGMTVSDVVLNPRYEFNFNLLRFSFIFLVLVACYLLKNREATKKLRDEFGYKEAAVNSVAICAAVSVAFWSLCASSELTPFHFYPLEGDIANYSPYVQQFDAFLKGQLHLDVQPSAELLALENPYSPIGRGEADCLFDRAFFEGKYYSYFGIAPIIFVYLPYYLIFGRVPTDSTVSGVFSFMTAFFLPLAVIEWSRFRNKIRPWLSTVLAVAVFFASSVLIIQRGRAQFYYVACIAGMAFVSAFLFFFTKWLNAKSKRSKILLMLFAGLSFAFGMLSRLNSVVPIAMAAVAFVIIYGIHSIKNKKTPFYLGEMAALGLPVAAAIAFLLWYNNARFGSPLQFGTAYQLTVADTSFYEISAKGIFPSVFHYFFQPFGFSDTFPYIGLTRTVLSDYGKYFYIDSNFGIFVYPIMLSLFLVPALLKNKKLSAGGKAMLSVCVLSLFITAFLNFCMGGVIFRYTADISVLAAFISAVIIGELCGGACENHGEVLAAAYKKTAFAASALTVFISLLASLMINGNLVTYTPDFYVSLKDFFVFWN